MSMKLEISLDAQVKGKLIYVTDKTLGQEVPEHHVLATIEI